MKHNLKNLLPHWFFFRQWSCRLTSRFMAIWFVMWQ